MYCTPLVLLTLACVTSAMEAPPIQQDCSRLFPSAGLSWNYYETIAHAVHSMTVDSLRIFNPRATQKNVVPTVNLNTTAPNRVLPYAPEVSPPGRDFMTPTMNRIDRILSTVGQKDDGLGPFWSPVERIAHYFHMSDVWENIRMTYDMKVLHQPPSNDVCKCLVGAEKNGIRASVEWVAHHYESGTPITLQGRPIPKLVDAKSWAVWKDRLLHYYTSGALYDGALYMHCVTKDF